MQIPLHSIDKDNLFIKYRDIKIVPESVEQAHRHDYYQFMFLENVSGTHDIDFESYGASDSSLHFVGKGRVHKVDFSTQVKGGVFLFPEAVFGSSESDLHLLHSFKYFNNGAYPILNLSKTDFASVMSLIEKIKQSTRLNTYEMSKYLLFALLIQVRELYVNAVGDHTLKKEPKELILFNSLLKEHFRDWNSMEDYVCEMGITITRLNSLCKEYYGRTALQVLHERKLLGAKRMLVYTEKQVKEIAYDCGFEDVAYFNRFFKKHTNCTPLTFRKNHL